MGQFEHEELLLRQEQIDDWRIKQHNGFCYWEVKNENNRYTGSISDFRGR